MAAKLFFCCITAVALIQSFNTLPAAEHKQEVIYRNSKGEYYTGDGVILTDQYPIYWRHKNAADPTKEHVVIVEPTITYTRQAEYSSTQAAPASSTTFRASAREGQSDFRPYDGRTESSAVAYYPYYIRASSSDRNDIEERRRIEESSRRVVVDASDPAYQRFIPRDSVSRDDRGQTWYYYSDNRQQRQQQQQQQSSTSSAPSPASSSQPSISSRSTVQFYFPNATAIRTNYNEKGKQVMHIHPNQYVIQVTEMTTTKTPRPETTTVDCPPYQPCNAVVYQQTTQCCKCYLVPSRCCPCTYPANKK